MELNYSFLLRLLSLSYEVFQEVNGVMMFVKYCVFLSLDNFASLRHSRNSLHRTRYFKINQRALSFFYINLKLFANDIYVPGELFCCFHRPRRRNPHSSW